MGIREAINKKKSAATSVAIVLSVLAVGSVIYELHLSAAPTGSAPTSRYYSDDDGATYFADSVNRIAPFDHNGKQAVIANVFKCNGAKAFVGYLQRYKAKANVAGPAPGLSSDTEVSLPGAGDKGWVNINSRAAYTLMDLKCPDGGTDIVPVRP